MSLVIDPNHAWRSAAFAKVPVMRVSHSDVERGVAQNVRQPEPVGVVNSESTKAWLDELDCCRVSELSARDGMLTGSLEVTTEVGSAKRGSADNSVANINILPYDYSRAAGTQLHMSYAGRHFIARPNIDETIVSAMYSADSADKWVTAAGIKLPRVTASQGQQQSVLGEGDKTQPSVTSNFEGLRRMMAECAKKDDYGDRLFNLARVVCHSSVKSKMKVTGDPTPAMSDSSARGVLSAVCPGLTPAELQNNVFVYTHTDESDDYRAFLTMGLRGVQQYVGNVQTIYSQCLVEAEAKPGDRIWFVRVAGADRGNWSPPVAAYMRVLDNPDVCLSYYYAYARSMGLGHVATAVLAQAAIGPHVWMKDAISPYKNCRPKLDAARYVILPTADKAEITLSTPSVLVNQAAVIGAALKAGLGGMLMAFKSGRDVDSQALMAGVMQKLSDPETRRTIMHAVTSRYRNGGVGLEWLSPFSYDVREGVTTCVEAWRSYGFMIADYNTCPVSMLSSCVSTGVEMTNSLIGRGTVVNERAYAQLVMCCFASGAELPGLCEKPTAGLLATVHSMAAKMREWQPVLNIVFMRGVEPPEEAMLTTPPRGHKPRKQSTTTEATSSQRPSDQMYEQSSRSASPEVAKISRPMVPLPTPNEGVKMRPGRPVATTASSEPELPVKVTHHNTHVTKHVAAALPSSSSSSGHQRVMSGNMPKPLLSTTRYNPPTWADEMESQSGGPQSIASESLAIRKAPPSTQSRPPSNAKHRSVLDKAHALEPVALQETKSQDAGSSNSSSSLSSQAKTVRKAADSMDL